MSVQDTILANALAGVIVAIAAAVLGLLVSRLITRDWDTLRAQQDRDATAAAEFYRAYGEFFASWKVWEAYSRKRRRTTGLTLPAEQRFEILARVARAEGAFESFLVKVATERELTGEQARYLWCFRAAYKELRYHVRDGAPLPWWRTHTPNHHDGYVAYQAFKGLATYVAATLAVTPSVRRLSAEQAHRNLDLVTGPSPPYLVGEVVPSVRSQLREADWEWVRVYEYLIAPRRVAVPEHTGTKEE